MCRVSSVATCLASLTLAARRATSSQPCLDTDRARHLETQDENPFRLVDAQFEPCLEASHVANQPRTPRVADTAGHE